MSASKWIPYQEYSDKGIDWLGEVPSHWEISTPRLMFEEIKDKNTDSARTNFLSLVSKKGIIPYEEKGNMGNKMSVNIDHYTLVNKGDFVLNSMNFGIGGFGVSPHDGITSPAYIVLRPTVEESLTRYLAKIFEDEGFQKGTAILGDGILELRRAIGWKHLKRQPIPIPSHEERIAIAKFLETGTSAIDELIPALQNLIVKIEEKRSTLITQLVTKGFNSDVSMKYSGIDWIGDIPEHWNSKKVKFVSKIFRGKFGHRPRNDPKLYNGQYPFVQTGNVARANKFLTDHDQTLNELGRSVSEEFPAGTIVMAIAANIGDVAILTFDACFPDSIVGFNPNQNINQEYLYYSLRALANELDKVASQSTQQNLNIELVGNLVIPVPPEKEQIAISKYISEVEQNSVQSAEKIEKLISQVKEYRTALISAAVTGKIDVRG